MIPMIHFLLLGYLPIWAMKLFIAPGFGAGCGQLFIASADAYAMAGGHREISTSLHDGVKLPRAFRRAGFFTDLFDATELATCRMYRGGSKSGRAFQERDRGHGDTHRPADLDGAAGRRPCAALAYPDPRPARGAVPRLRRDCRLAWNPHRPWLSGSAKISQIPPSPYRRAVMLAIQWSALWTAFRGRPATWRGRAYPSSGSLMFWARDLLHGIF